MRTFKFILKILLVIIFIFSVTANIVIFSSSYGSLLFKYDSTKYQSLHLFATTELAAFEDGTGLQIEATNVNGCNHIESKYYFDSISAPYDNILFYSKCTTDKYSETVYYREGVAYVDRDGTTSTETLSFANAAKKYYYFPTISNDLYLDSDLNKDTKTKPLFSFDPFYVLGISFTSFESKSVSNTYEYDLTGHLRKITTVDGDTTSVVKLNYKNQKIEIPNFAK